MAIGTITRIDAWKDANKRLRVCDVQLTSGANYTTGGETVTAAAVGMHKIVNVETHGTASTSDGATSRGVAVLYQSNGSVKLAATSSGSQVASNTDLSTYSLRCTFIGF